MGRGASLSDKEKGSILAYKEANMSTNAIATRVGRFWKVVSNFLKDPEAYGTKKSSAVYINGKQNDTKEELVAAIKKAWDEIPLLKLKRLVASMKKRCMEVYKLEGHKTKY
ncbi:Tc3 transposase [Phytophthora infestans]|uniref:Tc3 transposase n=1 Tax=Phytophthora infestans TaxID=4787 RepID=A0A8S9UDI2_PHYIN|nr:Tc3 transposase [Phytophthora infestans]